jgi:hypothetical protein
MKLVVKLPKGKKPFIGIIFSRSYDAEKSNLDLMTNHWDKVFRIEFIFEGQSANVKLICDDELIVRTYAHAGFDADKLRSWFYLTKDCKDFNFSQLYIQDGQEKVAKDFSSQKWFVLKVSGYKIISSEEKPRSIGVKGTWKEW